VPRQLRMSGMTGNVPYYGGRFTPAQAYAASHPPQPPPPRPAPGPPLRAAAVSDHAAALAALDQLLESGVVTHDEYDDLRARMAP
jgi:hypothetical protein